MTDPGITIGGEKELPAAEQDFNIVLQINGRRTRVQVDARTTLFHRVATLAADGAQPRAQNRFKVELFKRVVERALRQVGETA